MVSPADLKGTLPMNRVSLLSAVAALSLTSSPAFALCTPGTPNCIRLDGALAKAKHQIFDPGEVGRGEGRTCKNGEGGSTPYSKAVMATQTRKPAQVSE